MVGNTHSSSISNSSHNCNLVIVELGVNNTLPLLLPFLQGQLIISCPFISVIIFYKYFVKELRNLGQAQYIVGRGGRELAV
jgi:hypothetical protein